MRVAGQLIAIVVLSSGGVAAESPSGAASFANRGVGLGLGAVRVFGQDPSVPDAVFPLWLEYAAYVENGFEVFGRVPVALAGVRVGADTPDGRGLVLASGLQLGVRYLFLEEGIRPFVSLHLGGLIVVRQAALGDNVLTGPGVGAGLEVFVVSSVSLQARVFADWYVTLNAPQRFSVGATLTASTYF
jgi:outer membrane protein